MDSFLPLDQSNTSFTSPMADFDMNGWPTDADDWNTFYSFDALPVTQPSGFANQDGEDGLRTWHLLYGQHQLEAELQDFNKTPTATNDFGTEGPSLIIDPIDFEHVPVGFADPYRTDMFDSDKAETSEPGQGSFNPTWTDSVIPDNSDGNNNVLGVTTTSAAPGSSRECSCITCLDLGSERVWSWGKTSANYPCRLSDCKEDQSSYESERQRAARKHEKDHFHHEGQFRCIEDRCVYGAKRWPDLKRHYTSKHCLNPKTRFPCPEIGCKYGGNNGFTRKDKLKSHREKVHEKVAKPEKRFRVSKPTVPGAA